MGIIQRLQAFLQPDSIKVNPAYQGMVAYSDLPQAKRMEDNYKAYAREGYRNDTVYKCIRYIAFNGAAIPPKLYTDRTMQKEIEDHELLDRLNSPNNEQSGLQYREAVLSYKLLSGNSFQYAIRPAKNGPPAELWSLRPDLISVMTAKSRGIVGYKYEYLEELLEPESIGHTKYWHPEDEVLGLSPLKIAGLMIDQQRAAKTWNLALLQNSARPPGAWVVPTPLSSNDRARLEESLKNKLQGYRNAGTPPVLDAGLTWQSMSAPPGELEYLSGIQYNAAQIANVFSIAPQLIGDTSASTYDNMEQAQYAAYADAIFPELDDLYGLWNVWLLPMYPDLKNAFLYYDKESVETIQKLIQERKDAQADRANKMWSTGMMTLNEARETAGLKTIDSGDVFFFPGTGKVIQQTDLQSYAEQSAAPPPPPVHMLPPGAPAPGDGGKPEPGKEGEQAKPEDQQQQEEQAKALLGLLRKWRDEEAHNRPEIDNRPPETKALDLETAEQKAAYIESLERLRGQWEEEATNQLQQYFAKEHSAVVSAIQRGPARLSPDWDAIIAKPLEQKEKDLKSVMTKIYQDTAAASASQVLRSLKSQSGPSERKDDSTETDLQDYLDIFGPDILEYLLSFAGERVVGIMDTTRKQIKAALMEGVVQGESIPNLAKRIDDLYLQQIIPNRSTVISRTEVIAASNYGSMAAAQQSGLTLNKVWLATGDHRTRDTHLEADGQEVGIDEPFDVGGSKLMFPGDSSMGAPPEETIQCRCTTFYRRVKPDGESEDTIDADGEEKGHKPEYRAFLDRVFQELA